VNIILLGATGFIGSNIISQLVDSGCEVFAFIRQANRSSNLQVAGVHWLTRTDLVNEVAMPPIDAILSAAGNGNPAIFEADPSAGLDAESRIADWLCELAVKFNVSKVVYLSSAGAVYGEGWRNSVKSAFHELDPCLPISTYGKCKLMGEELLAKKLDAAGLQKGMTILRASNVYGLHYAKNGRQGLVNALVDQALSHQPITVYGDGMIYRDYLYSSDLANAIMRILLADSCGIFNIASGISYSIIDVIEEIENAVGYHLNKRFEPSRGFDVRYSGLSISKAHRILAWSPKVSLQSGIELLLEHRRRLMLTT
jgi:UDP-glucose 4-epimerase